MGADPLGRPLAVNAQAVAHLAPGLSTLLPSPATHLMQVTVPAAEAGVAVLFKVVCRQSSVLRDR